MCLLFSILSVAYKNVDENLYREDSPVQLAEEPNSNLPFELPDDGYTCENLRGIPDKLFDFIEPMNRAGLCRLFTNRFSLGLWTEFLNMSKVNENFYLSLIKFHLY